MEPEEKQAKIHAILDGAEKELQALGLPYFMAAVDRDARDPDGGNVFVVSEVKGQDMQIIFKHAFPSNKDVAALGLWVGAEIMRRNKDANISFRDKKKGSKPQSVNQVEADAEAVLENLRYNVRRARIKATKKGHGAQVREIYGDNSKHLNAVSYENTLDEAQLNELLTKLNNIFNN